MSIAFFHQNEVIGAQGGIQRYIATLMDQGGKKCFLVTEDVPGRNDQRLRLHLPVIRGIPKWIRFTWTIWNNVSEIRSFLRQNEISVLEFSRPEYAIFAFLFPGKKVFTFHGTGPINTELAQKAVTFVFSWLVLFQADSVQIVGPDARALPWIAQKLLKKKISFIDAWFDDCFSPSPFPDTAERIRVFYAGRLHPQKNPELLFAIAGELHKKYGEMIEFNYFGADGSCIPPELYGKALIDRGLQTAPDLAKAIAQCHFGVLTSFYEGSPFIVVEGLACGRGYVLPPVLGLLRTYSSHRGVFFSKEYTVSSFIEKIETLIRQIRENGLDPMTVAQGVKYRSKAEVAQSIISKLGIE